VLHDPGLKRAWIGELEAMRERIAGMRRALHSRLTGRISGPRLDLYVRQRGMFTYTGLTETQVDRLRFDHGVYILRSGRLCVAGLNDANVDIAAQAIATVSAQAAN
jgi:aromatic-amino-acid transaminase